LNQFGAKIAAMNMLLLLSYGRAEFMVQPSSWIEQGITTQIVRELEFFKFTEELRTHFEGLIEKHKNQRLSEAQEAELRGLQELDRIFTLLNARSIS